METITILWTSLGLIFVLFIIASAIIYANAKRSLPYVDSIYTKQSSAKTSYWKVVKGTIQKSSLEYREHKRLLRSPVRQYRPRVTYDYFAYDRKYSHSIPLMNWTNDKNEALRSLEKHQAQSAIVVRFHPEQPASSIIELSD